MLPLMLHLLQKNRILVKIMPANQAFIILKIAFGGSYV